MIEATLDERHKRYGYYSEVCETTYAIRDAVMAQIDLRGTKLAADQLYSIEMICVKLARLINGDPDYDDNWRDIAGYSQLIVDRLSGRAR